MFPKIPLEYLGTGILLYVVGFIGGYLICRIMSE